MALDDTGRPSFQRLQGRSRLSRPIDIRHAVVETPVTYYAFDLLGFEDFDLRPLPLTARKAILQRLLPPVGALRYLEHVEDDGEALYREAERLGLEGIVAKKATAPYKAGRSPVWLKVRSRKTADYVVVGYTAPKGSRSGFGALHLAEFVDGALTYTGRVGSGFNDRQLADVSRTLQQHRRATARVRRSRARGEGDGLGRAAPGVRGGVHRMDGGRAPAAAGVSPVPGGQAAGGVCEGGRAGGRAGGRRTVGSADDERGRDGPVAGRSRGVDAP